MLASYSSSSLSHEGSKINTNESKLLSPKYDNEIGKKIDFLKSSFGFFNASFFYYNFCVGN